MVRLIKGWQKEPSSVTGIWAAVKPASQPVALSLQQRFQVLPSAGGPAEIRCVVQTVAPSAVTDSAKPLAQPKVDKGRVWLIFLVGAGGLFAGTVLLENNESLFPAIAKSNKVLAASKKAMVGL